MHKYYTVKVVHLDLAHDVALLKVQKILEIKDKDKGLSKTKFIEHEKALEEFSYVTFDDRKLYAGEPVMTIGFPGEFKLIVAEGIVSSPIEHTRAMSEEKVTFKNLTLTSMLIFPGNSGGPVFDKYGHIVGIATLGSNVGRSVSFFQHGKYAHQLLNNKSKTLIVHKAIPYNKKYDEE